AEVVVDAQRRRSGRASGLVPFQSRQRVIIARRSCVAKLMISLALPAADGRQDAFRGVATAVVGDVGAGRAPVRTRPEPGPAVLDRLHPFGLIAQSDARPTGEIGLLLQAA